MNYNFLKLIQQKYNLINNSLINSNLWKARNQIVWGSNASVRIRSCLFPLSEDKECAVPICA
jgi:hypothetical protein